MKSFVHNYLLDHPLNQKLLIAVRTLGEFRGRQGLYRDQFPEVLDTLKKVATIQSVESSNRIEGINIPAERLDAIVAKRTRPKGHSEQEVAGYRDVLSEIHTNAQKHRISTGLILGWHADMYKYAHEKAAGVWKKEDNAILEELTDGTKRVRFTPLPAAATPASMDQLCRLYLGCISDGSVEPLLAIASFILDFECIHPFKDGNGRMGRLVTLLLLYHAGYEVGRFVSLERIIEDSKETYYETLLKSSQRWHEGEHDLMPWWNYFLGMLTAAYGEFEDRVGTLTSARGAKREMVIGSIRRLPEEFSFSDLRRVCPGVSFATLKRALQDLKKKKRIIPLGKGRDARWKRIGIK